MNYKKNVNFNFNWEGEGGEWDRLTNDKIKCWINLLPL